MVKLIPVAALVAALLPRTTEAQDAVTRARLQECRQLYATWDAKVAAAKAIAIDEPVQGAERLASLERAAGDCLLALQNDLEAVKAVPGGWESKDRVAQSVQKRSQEPFARRLVSCSAPRTGWASRTGSPSARRPSSNGTTSPTGATRSVDASAPRSRFPIGRCWSGCGMLVHLRGGWSVSAPDAIVHLGDIPTSLTVRGRVAFGGSLSFDKLVPLRVDVAARNYGDGLRWTVALSARYGVSFRDVTRAFSRCARAKSSGRRRPTDFISGRPSGP